MPFDPGFEEVIKWPSHFRKVGDEASIEVGKSLECAILRSIGGNFPLLNSGDFDWVHHNRAIFSDNSKELNPSGLKNALAGFHVEVQFL